MPVPEDCVALGLVVYQETAPTSEREVTYTVRKNGSDTDIAATLTLISSNPMRDTGYVEFDEDDRISIYASVTEGIGSNGADAHVAVLLGKKLPAVNLT